MSMTRYRPEEEPGSELHGFGDVRREEECRPGRREHGGVEHDTVRLSLEISRDLDDLLVSLARTVGTTKSELLLKAIALMDVAVKAKQNDEKLYVSKQAPEGASREIVGI